MILAAQALICVVYCFARHKFHNGLVLSVNQNLLLPM
jgi:hypothetical protein